MKIHINLPWLANPQAGWKLILCAGLVGATLALASGCHKSTQSPPPTPQITNEATPQANANESQPAPQPHPAAAPTTKPNGVKPDLQALNRAVTAWTIRNHRYPKNFEDFAASAGIKIPAPPPGEKYALNGKGIVILVPNSTQ